jgi:16S rRNA (guanine527-N7)-methyltransferase
MNSGQLAGRITGPEAFAAAFAVSRETVDKLAAYEALLRQWQKAVNLVAPGTLDDVWHRHFADSAQLLRLAPAKALSWLDLGSGGGFPGLVLAILLADRPGARVALVESDTRKAAFQREVARQTGAPVDIWSARIETLSTQTKLRKVDVITARALAPLKRLLGLSAPFFGPSTVALYLKGREADREVAEAKMAWQFELKSVPSVTEPQGRVLVITKLNSQSED